MEETPHQHVATLDGHAIDPNWIAEMPLFKYNFVYLLIAITTVYMALVYLALNYTKEPQKLVDGKWTPMTEKDAVVHRLDYVSYVHAWTWSFLWFYLFYMESLNFNKKTSLLQHFIVCNSWAYFISDSVWGFYKWAYDIILGIHHISAIMLLLITLCQKTGGFAIWTGLLIGEVPNPLYLYREALKRKGLSKTDLYLYVTWVYCSMYFIFRGVGITWITYPLALSINVSYAIKLVFMPLVFFSYAWLLLMAAILWKTLPRWFADPEKVKKASWWINGKIFFQKWTKDPPGMYITVSIIVVITMLLPLSLAYYAHYVDNSFGYVN